MLSANDNIAICNIIRVQIRLLKRKLSRTNNIGHSYEII